MNFVGSSGSSVALDEVVHDRAGGAGEVGREVEVALQRELALGRQRHRLLRPAASACRRHRHPGRARRRRNQRRSGSEGEEEDRGQMVALHCNCSSSRIGERAVVQRVCHALRACAINDLRSRSRRQRQLDSSQASQFRWRHMTLNSIGFLRTSSPTSAPISRPKKNRPKHHCFGRPAILDVAGSPPASSNCCWSLHALAEERRGRERRGRAGVAQRARPRAGLDLVDLLVVVRVDACGRCR